MNSNSHTPQNLTGRKLASFKPGAWVAWYSERFGSCVGQVVLPPSGRWAIVLLKEPRRQRELPIWVFISKVQLLCPNGALMATGHEAL